VLVPNPYYRMGKGQLFDNVPAFNFTNKDDMAKLQPLMDRSMLLGIRRKMPWLTSAGWTSKKK